MGTPYFSIIMPLYNHEDFVAEAVDSALTQTFSDFELVVCNDGSTDASLAKVDAFDDPRIRIIEKPNGGTVSALNSCLLNAQGRYVCWLSSDDIFAPGKLAAHATHHQRTPDSLISVAPFGYLRDGKRSAGVQIRPDSGSRLAQFLSGNYVNGLSVCASRSMYARHGLFDSRFRYAHDVERWFEFLVHQEATYLDGNPQSFSRLGTSNVADADLLGEIDVLKIVYSRLARSGLKGLLPNSRRHGCLDKPLLASLCNALFSTRSLFSRFHMVPALIQLVSRSVMAERLQSVLMEVAVDIRLGTQHTDPAPIPHCIDLVLQRAGEGSREEAPSFAEQLLALRSAVSSDVERRVIDRYLREGL